jgi:hypothetical protein
LPPAPVRPLLSVAVKMNVSPDVVPVVKSTFATPSASVVLVAVTHEPPTGVFVQVTTTPLV